MSTGPIPLNRSIPGNPPRVVALGGGHGLSATLTALRHLTRDLTAVVTVADNGGSSGRLREGYDVLPPGDLRMALAALCDDSGDGRQWREILQHRFPPAQEGASDRSLRGHALGNLMILTAWERLGGPVLGLAELARLIGARGTVLPMASTPLGIEATVVGHDPEGPHDITVVTGQHQIAGSRGAVQAIRLLPRDPEAEPEAVRAVLEAEWVILGPGSWFTSVMPHLMVPQLREAIEHTPARRVLTLIVDSTGENDGRSPADQVAAVLDHAPGLLPDVVLVDREQVSAPGDADALERIVGRAGGRLQVAELANRSQPGSHDVMRLATAYHDLIGER